MRGPERERHREAFERWYRSSAAHAEAYDEAMAGFEEAGVLRQGEVGRARNLPERHRPTVPLRYAFGAVAAAAVVALIFLVSAYVPSTLPGRETLERYTTAGEAREVRVADGSRVTLGPGTVAIVALTRNERRITLHRGRGRFSVAHDARPFLVAAGEAEVVAHGTVFEVSLTGGRTQVSLIEGSIDVSYPGAQSGKTRRQVRRLQPGQQITVGTPPESRVARAPMRRDEPASAMMQFDDTPLAQAVAEANRRSRAQISLADASIGELRITGAFRAGDAAAFAESLAAAFRLHLERRADGTLVLLSRADRGS